MLKQTIHSDDVSYQEVAHVAEKLIKQGKQLNFDQVYEKLEKGDKKIISQHLKDWCLKNKHVLIVDQVPDDIC